MVCQRNFTNETACFDGYEPIMFWLINSVPYEAKKDFPITPDYTVPKGSMVIPTLWHSLHDESVYPQPNEFNPSRWGPDGIAEQHPKYPPSKTKYTNTYRNWLVFGTGP